MTEEKKNGLGPIEMLIKAWPIILAIITLVAGWVTMRSQIGYLEGRVGIAEARITKLESVRDEDRRMLDQNLEGIRNALGRQQLTLARICVMVSKGKECD